MYRKALKCQYHAMWFVVLWVAVVTSPASASLIGDRIMLTVDDGSAPFFMGTAIGDEATVEFINVSSSAFLLNDVNILDDDTIEIRLTLGALGQGSFGDRNFTFTGVDWGGLGTVVNLINFNTVGDSSFDSFDLLSPTSFRINGVTQAVGSMSVATLTFDVVALYAVPEPITVTLGLMGLGALGMAVRRRTA